MNESRCSISFFRNDLHRIKRLHCPVKNCSSNIYNIRFNKKSFVPFCPEHGLTIHSGGFVYYNGNTEEGCISAIKRNLMFHADYYISGFFRKNNKIESGRLCYESSEDAVSYNVFTELLSSKSALKQVVELISGKSYSGDVDLYLWGNKINIDKCTTHAYEPLEIVRNKLEYDIKHFKTEPDIMLVVPNNVVICIEAKFGGKNPLSHDKEIKEGEKPKNIASLVERYCRNNMFMNMNEVFNYESQLPKSLHEQIFRNIVFAASMAKLEGARDWYVANLRSQHIINIKRGKPESKPVMRDVCSILNGTHKRRFKHLTWEDIYAHVIKDEPHLNDLRWYLKNKSYACSRAFNIM